MIRGTGKIAELWEQCPKRARSSNSFDSHTRSSISIVVRFYRLSYSSSFMLCWPDLSIVSDSVDDFLSILRIMTPKNLALFLFSLKFCTIENVMLLHKDYSADMMFDEVESPSILWWTWCIDRMSKPTWAKWIRTNVDKPDSLLYYANEEKSSNLVLECLPQSRKKSEISQLLRYKFQSWFSETPKPC